MRPRVKKLMLMAPFAIAGMLLFAAIGGEIVRLLWNWLLPPLFGWKTIGFWQALGLLVLGRILFGGRGFSRSNRSEMRHRMAERMGERWAKMTPEEREKYRQSFRARWGAFEPPDPGPTP